MSSDTKTSNRITLPVALGSYVTLFEPRVIGKNDDGKKKPKYSMSLLWPKSDDLWTKGPKEGGLAELVAVIDAVATKKFGPNAPDLLRKGKLKSPIHDGDVDMSDHKEYAGMIYVNASNQRKPGLVDGKRNVIFEQEEAYSGCFFRAQVSVVAYDVDGGKGVTLYLENVQRTAKGERIDGRQDAADVFDEVEETGSSPAPAGSKSAAPIAGGGAPVAQKRASPMPMPGGAAKKQADLSDL